MTKENVASFLSAFITKSKVFGIVFRGDRKKNINTLAHLEITALQMEQEILSLSVENYCSGPITDTLNKGADMWVFGKLIKETEVYIKITLGNFGNSTICLSYHIAEHKMKYPFSKK